MSTSKRKQFSLRELLHFRSTGGRRQHSAGNEFPKHERQDSLYSARTAWRFHSTVKRDEGIHENAEGEEVEKTNERGHRAASDKPLPLSPPDANDDIGMITHSPEITINASPAAEDLLINLVDENVMQRVAAGPASTRAEGVLNTIEDAIESATNPQGVIAKYAAPIKDMLDASGATRAIQAGLETFMEDIPWLMKGLDEVARIHPVVTVAVLAFKAVYTMELTRRENDKRIWSLYIEMKDMIAVLIQLRDIKDPQDVGPDGRTIEARLQGLVKQTVEDIKNCANLCDTYSKKRLLVKVLKGFLWEAKLVEFVATFAQRRMEFEQALTIHISRAVNAMNATLSSVKLTTDAINEKIAVFLQVFETFASPEEAEMRVLIQQKGDMKTVQNNESVLLELSDCESRLTPRKAGVRAGQEIRANTVKDLKEELRLDLDVALKRNLDTFGGKFELYHRQLREELAQFIHDENAQLLTAIQEGPHDKIENDELRNIWKEMNWRRNVKSRLFVMTLRDHFREKVEGIGLATALRDSDHWALRYVGVPWLPSIMEAFDDDGSGYITVSEVNDFMRALPRSLGWSLQHWIAYWAVGWKATTMQYKNNINSIFDQMFAMRSRLRPENRYGADQYLLKVWQSTVELTLAFHTDDKLTDMEMSKFAPYAQFEERRIHINLRDIRYDIDALDTVSVVAGRGRIERHLLILIYLLVKRDLDIFSIGQSRAIHPDELANSAASLIHVFDAAVYRVRDLSEFYRQHRLNVAAQFQTVASGLFTYYNDSRPLWSMKTLEHPPFNTGDPHTDVSMTPDPQLILTYDLPKGPPFVLHGYAEPSLPQAVYDSNVPMPLKSILGQWNGFIYTPDEYPYYPMTSLTFVPSAADDQTFMASGRHYSNEEYTLQGRCSLDEDGVVTVSFCISFPSGPEFFVGSIDDSGALVGYRGWEEDVSETKHNDLFILKRVPEEIMSQRPSPFELSQNRACAWWRFAMRCTVNDIRKQRWSWFYFRERRRVRKRYLALNVRFWDYGPPLDDDESTEYILLRRSLTLADAMYYRSLGDYLTRLIPRHHPYLCDGCSRDLGGGRITCIECPPPSAEDFTDTIDFCDLFCAQTTVTSEQRTYLEEGKPHTTEHDICKVRTVLCYRDIPELRQKSREALRLARIQFEPMRDIADQADHNAGEAHSDVYCAVCLAILAQPCWYCVECSDTFICDACESDSLLTCRSCREPFTQPQWYYGKGPRDNFMCNRCTAKGDEPARDTGSLSERHIYTHPLVRCTKRVLHSTDPPPPTTNDRLINLENRVEGVDMKLDRLRGELDNRLSKMENTLESMQRALTLIVSRVAGYTNGST